MNPMLKEFLFGGAIGLVLGWVVLWSFLKPELGRLLARLIGVLAIGAGVLCVVMAVADLAKGDRNATYEFLGLRGGFGPTLGTGVGLLVVGVMILVLARARKTTTTEQQPQASDQLPDKPAERADGYEGKRSLRT
jgi:hypothetical protein